MQQLKKSDAVIFILPALTVMMVITVYPFLYTVILSLHNWNLAAFRGKQFVGIDNYLDFFTNPDVWHSLKVTAIYVVSCVGIEFLLGIGRAFLFDTQFRDKK